MSRLTKVALLAAAAVCLGSGAAEAACSGLDIDGDGVCDVDDNCLTTPNTLQIDTDCDGFGNACDPDFDNSGLVGVSDIGAFVLGSTDMRFDIAPPFNGVSDSDDYDRILSFLGSAPGPSGLAEPPDCDAPADFSDLWLAALPPLYCVKGTGTGAAYAWQVIPSGAAPIVNDNNVPAAPAGSSAGTLMMHLQSQIQQQSATSGVDVTAVLFGPQAACFKLSDPAAVLDVGAAGCLPTACCTVPVGGSCAFNPVIYQLAGTAVPALPSAALPFAGVLLGSLSLVVLRRRTRQRSASND